MNREKDKADMDLKIEKLSKKIEENGKLLERIIEGDLKKKKEDDEFKEKFTTHVEFIDNVYSRVSHPLHWACGKINNMISTESIENVENDQDEYYLE